MCDAELYPCADLCQTDAITSMANTNENIHLDNSCLNQQKEELLASIGSKKER